MPSLRKIRRLTFPLAIVILVALSLTGARDALSAKPDPTIARTDKATMPAGTTKTIKVLANDTLKGGPSRATIRILKTATGIKATTIGRTVKVTVATTTGPGTYALAYRVTAAAKTTDRATIRITVTTPASTPTPAPEPSTTPTPTPTPEPSTTATPTPSTTPVADNTLLGRINSLPVAPEQRTGYDRDLFKHWNSGLPTSSGGISYCDTRDEVLIAESVTKATWTGTSCTLTGQWYSYYDGITITNPSDVDMDHLIPLAESFDSGAYGWDATKREAFANDQGDPRSLVGVTYSANRGKGDQDPAEWLPIKERCRYIGEWVAIKHRWGLSLDASEKDALLYTARGCDNVVVDVIPIAG